MLLAIDIGNTDTVAGFFDRRALGTVARRPTPGADGCLALIEEILTEGPAGEIDCAVVASVVPGLDGAVEEALKARTRRGVLFVGRDLDSPIPLAVDRPAEVGADRVANAVAAFERHGSPVLVADLGTAITIDFVNERGEYAGGVIAPGPDISARALFSRAALLREVEIGRPKRVVGKNTAECIRSGIYYGFLSLVDGLIERMTREVGRRPPVVATGGWAPLFAGESEYLGEVDGNLTLKGIEIIYRRARGA